MLPCDKKRKKKLIEEVQSDMHFDTTTFYGLNILDFVTPEKIDSP